MPNYPLIPGAKGGETSFEAAASVERRAQHLRGVISKMLADPNNDGMTADEIAMRLNESVLSVRPRVSELHRRGAVGDTGLRRFNASGHRAIVWTSVGGGVDGQAL